MRRVLAFGLVMAVAFVGMPVGAYAAAKAPAARQGQGTGSVNGVAHGADRTPLRNYTVRLRSTADGHIAGTTTSSGAGDFSFAGLQPGNYIVEVVDAAGKVVGLSPSIAVGAGAMVSVTVTASAAGAIAAAAGGGFGLLGLGTAASVAVIGAAGAATAIVAVQSTASGSK